MLRSQLLASADTHVAFGQMERRGSGPGPRRRRPPRPRQRPHRPRRPRSGGVAGHRREDPSHAPEKTERSVLGTGAGVATREQLAQAQIRPHCRTSLYKLPKSAGDFRELVQAPQKQPHGNPRLYKLTRNSHMVIRACTSSPETATRQIDLVQPRSFSRGLCGACTSSGLPTATSRHSSKLPSPDERPSARRRRHGHEPRALWSRVELPPMLLYTTIPGCTRFVGHVVGYDVQRTRRLPTTAHETSGSPPDSCCEDSITRYAFDGTTYREVIARPTRQRQLDDASRVPFPTTRRGPRPRPATPEASKSRTIVRHLTRRSPPDTFRC